MGRLENRHLPRSMRRQIDFSRTELHMATIRLPFTQHREDNEPSTLLITYKIAKHNIIRANLTAPVTAADRIGPLSLIEDRLSVCRTRTVSGLSNPKG
jgi:hypothetical protein